MNKLFCNGCERGPLTQDEVQQVELREASMRGTRNVEFGLATDRVTHGVLCVERCIPALRALVGEITPSGAMAEALETLSTQARLDVEQASQDERERREEAARRHPPVRLLASG